MKFTLFPAIMFALIVSGKTRHALGANPQDELKLYLTELETSKISPPQICEINTNIFLKNGLKPSKSLVDNLNKYAAKKFFHLHLESANSCLIKFNSDKIPKDLLLDKEWSEAIKYFAGIYKGALCEGFIDIVNNKMSDLNMVGSKIFKKDSIFNFNQSKDSLLVDTRKNNVTVKVYSSGGKLKQTSITYKNDGLKLRPHEIVVDTPHNGQKIENRIDYGFAFFPIKFKAKIHAYNKVIDSDFLLENCRPR